MLRRLINIQRRRRTQRVPDGASTNERMKYATQEQGPFKARQPDGRDEYANYRNARLKAGS